MGIGTVVRQVRLPGIFRKRHPPVGASPGTLMVSPEALPPSIRVYDYGLDHLDEREITDVEQLLPYATPRSTIWVDVQGLGDEAMLRRIGQIFSLHPLALEDAVNVPQRPKTEAYDQHQLFITRMVRCSGRGYESEQVSLFIGRGYLLTLQEKHGDVFDPVRKRLRSGQGLMRGSGPDYLAYALIDTVVDGYYPVLETLGDRLQELEEIAFSRPSPGVLQQIHGVRRELLGLRRAIWPQREAINTLVRDESTLVSTTVRMYLRDAHDHAMQIVDVIETYRELAASLMDLYLSGLSQRTNEVMKVLTIMASIFIPLTFIAGVYGMNFEYMPELHRRWGYPIVWAIMIVTAGFMVWSFWKRGWIGEEGVRSQESGMRGDAASGPGA